MLYSSMPNFNGGLTKPPLKLDMDEYCVPLLHDNIID